MFCFVIVFPVANGTVQEDKEEIVRMEDGLEMKLVCFNIGSYFFTVVTIEFCL